eukprot:351645-Chlamydomonas_euryale.AAC.12
MRDSGGEHRMRESTQRRAPHARPWRGPCMRESTRRQALHARPWWGAPHAREHPATSPTCATMAGSPTCERAPSSELCVRDSGGVQENILQAEGERAAARKAFWATQTGQLSHPSSAQLLLQPCTHAVHACMRACLYARVCMLVVTRIRMHAAMSCTHAAVMVLKLRGTVDPTAHQSPCADAPGPLHDPHSPTEPVR